MNSVNGVMIPAGVKSLGANMVNVSAHDQKKFIDSTTMALQLLIDKGVVSNYNAMEYKMFSENILQEIQDTLLSNEEENFPAKADIYLAIVSRMLILSGHKISKEAYEHLAKMEKELLAYGLSVENFYFEKDEEGNLVINVDQTSMSILIQQNHERIKARMETLK